MITICTHLTGIVKIEKIVSMTRTNCLATGSQLILTNCFSWGPVARCRTYRESRIVQSWITNHDVCSWEMEPFYQLLSSTSLFVASYKGILLYSVHCIVVHYFLQYMHMPFFSLTYFDGFWLLLWFLQTFLLYLDAGLLFAQTHCCYEQRNTTGNMYTFCFTPKRALNIWHPILSPHINILTPYTTNEKVRTDILIKTQSI